LNSSVVHLVVKDNEKIVHCNANDHDNKECPKCSSEKIECKDDKFTCKYCGLFFRRFGVN